MAISLKKGGNVPLTKSNPGLTKLKIELTWDKNVTDSGHPHDLDLSVVILGENDKVLVDGMESLVYYNGSRVSPDGSIEYTGDNRDGDGDIDEAMFINLPQVNQNIKKIAVLTSIDKAEERRQNFGQVRNARIRVYNAETNEELVNYDLSEDASTEIAMTLGTVYRDISSAGDWKFKAVGTGFAGGYGPLLQSYGLTTE